MAVEAQFYALLPLIAAGTVWLLGRGRIALMMGLGGLLLSSPLAQATSVGLKQVVPGFERHVGVLAVFSYMSVFAAGLILACVYVVATSGDLNEARVRALSRGGLSVFAVIFGYYVVTAMIGIGSAAVNYYGFALAMAVCYGGLLLHTVLDPESVVSRALAKPVPRFIGDISFSVYLLHKPLLDVVIAPFAARFDGIAPLPVALGAVLVIVVPAATALFWFVERPFLQKKTNAKPAARSRHMPPATPPC